jgi:hypothetical protein
VRAGGGDVISRISSMAVLPVVLLTMMMAGAQDRHSQKY